MTALLGLDLAGRRALVAGGGPAADECVRRLLEDGAHVHVVAAQLCEPLAARAAAGQVTWRQAEVVASDLDDAWLVCAATGERTADAAVSTWADARRVWCIDAGLGGTGSAHLPELTRSGDLTVGVVSSGPVDATRTAHVRDALAEHLRSGAVDLRTRRAAVPGSGRVVLVGGGPGAVDLLTLRGRRALAEADVVVTDRLGPTTVLTELARDVEVVDVGKTPGHHAVPQHEINRILVERAQRGQRVVRLKGGDPFVFGRGGEEVIACHDAGVAVEVIPGVSSVLAAPAVAGIPLTHRGTTGAYLVINGHTGLDPAARLVLRERSATLVILMGASVLAGLVADALTAGADPATPVAIIENGATEHQRVTRDRLDAITDAAVRVGVRAPALIVIGDVAAPGLLDGGRAPEEPSDATMSP